MLYGQVIHMYSRYSRSAKFLPKGTNIIKEDIQCCTDFSHVVICNHVEQHGVVGPESEQLKQSKVWSKTTQAQDDLCQLTSTSE